MNEEEADELVRTYDLKKLVARELVTAENSPEIIEEHKKRT